MGSRVGKSGCMQKKFDLNPYLKFPRLLLVILFISASWISFQQLSKFSFIPLQLMNGQVVGMVFQSPNRDVQVAMKMDGTKAGGFKTWKTRRIPVQLPGQKHPMGYEWISNFLV